MSHKSLFSRALKAAPGRLHFAAHSHHPWPDASFEGHQRAWDDAARLADTKWDAIFGEIVPTAQAEVAAELGLPDPSTVVFAPNTHDFLIRLASAHPAQGRLKLLSTDGEFHAFRRQAARWEEAGQAVVTRVPLEPFDSFADRFVSAAETGGFDWIVLSQVFFKTGQVVAPETLARLAALARPDGPWVLVDGYHGFMALRTDLGPLADRLFYVSGGYKYAMSGEGVGLLHAPPEFGPRPVVTGWFAEFGDLQGPPGGVGYSRDAGRFWGATFDATGLYRFVAVRRALGEAGLTTDVISAHAERLARRFFDHVSAGRAGRLAEAAVLNPLASGPRARFIAFEDDDAQAWRAALLAADVVTDVRDRVIRFGFGLYQDEDDVDALAERCARVLA